MRISDNRRYLVQDDGTPFLYLADTVWALFYEATLEEAEHYLRVRAEQGFTVIMPVLVWDESGNSGRFGRQPFHDHDASRPNESFWAHVDHVIEIADTLGLKMALLPTWGHYVIPARWGAPPIFSPDNARAYGVFLGQRYGRQRDLIWVLGGDRNPHPDEPQFAATWPALAAGLKEGDGGKNLMTYHPTGVYSSSQWFHDARWLDFNMWQTSTRIHVDYCATLLQDYNRTPVKPFLDGETRYEHSHRYFGRQGPCGVRMTPKRVRQAAYYAMLCGALGHTYGCRDAWSFHVPSDQPPWRDVDTYWKAAIQFPAAWQLRHWRALFTDYPWYNLVPDQAGALVTRGNVEGSPHIQGAYARDGDFALVYLPDDVPVWVDLSKLEGKAVDARWFDPVTGTYTFIQRYHEKAVQRFYWSQNPGEQDHILVLSAV